MYYQIAINAPINPNILTYESDLDLSRGDLVQVPLGRRKEKGVVLGSVSEYNEEFKIKNIESLIEDFKIQEEDLKLYQWMGKYYHYPMGKIVFDSLPKALKRPRELNFIQGQGNDFSFDLNADQQEVYEDINSKVDLGFSKFLIHGITGSGKTEIYLRVIKNIIAQGK